MSDAHGVAGWVWGGDGWVSVDRRLFHRCGVWVALELSRDILIIIVSTVTDYEHYL